MVVKGVLFLKKIFSTFCTAYINSKIGFIEPNQEDSQTYVERTGRRERNLEKKGLQS